MAVTVYDSEKIRAIIYPLAVGFLIPGLIGLFHPELIDVAKFLVVMVSISVLPGYVFFSISNTWLNGDPLFRKLAAIFRPMLTFCPLGTDMKNKGFPWVTILLIILNLVFFLFIPEAARRDLGFPPYQCESINHFGVAFVMHAFLHADVWHLMGNMIFLWVFGSSVERRIGHSRFLVIYFACIAACKTFCLIMMVIQDSGFQSIGASGAISGVMGIFAVRCYFSRVSIGMPFLYLPWFVVPVQVQTLALICLYFAMNTAGSCAMFEGNLSGTNYWAHSGGYLFGFWLAFTMRFHIRASEESISVRVGRLRQNDYRKKEAAKIYQDMLEKNPEDVDALMFLLSHYKYNEKQPYVFGKLLNILIVNNMEQAVALFNSFYPRHLYAVSGKTALALGIHFHKILALEKARHCLEVARFKAGPWQAKATFLLGKVFQALGNRNRAQQFFEETRKRFHNTPFAREAKSLLMGAELNRYIQ